MDGWYNLAEKSWSILAENRWYILAENEWYIYVRKLTPDNSDGFSSPVGVPPRVIQGMNDANLKTTQFQSVTASGEPWWIAEIADRKIRHLSGARMAGPHHGRRG